MTDSYKNQVSAFVTGAGGLLGSHITRELLKRNINVVAFIETGKEPYTINGLSGVKIVYGNILNKQEVVRASAGCDYIIHAAASTTVMPARAPFIKEVNIIGTQNVINAALENKVKRLVYVGSANTFGYGSITSPGNEKKPYCCGKFGLDYMDSKLEAHKLVLHMVRTKNLPAIIVCPTFMLGKYDSKPGSGAMVVSVHSGKLPGYSRGGRNYIYAGDAAVAVVNSIELGRIGEAYILGNQNLDYKTAFSLIAKTIGVRSPRINMPKPVVLLYGFFCDCVNKVTKRTMPVNLPMAKIANEGFYYDCSKAIEELKLPQTPIEIAIGECFSWLKKEGLLNNKS